MVYRSPTNQFHQSFNLKEGIWEYIFPRLQDLDMDTVELIIEDLEKNHAAGDTDYNIIVRFKGGDKSVNGWNMIATNYGIVGVTCMDLEAEESGESSKCARGAHEFKDFGFRKTWCSLCNATGEWVDGKAKVI